MSVFEFGYGMVVGGSVIAVLLEVSIRFVYLFGCALDVFGLVSFLYCIVVLMK